MARSSDSGKVVAWRGRIRRFGRSGMTVVRFCRKEGVSTASFYRWRRISTRFVPCWANCCDKSQRRKAERSHASLPVEEVHRVEPSLDGIDLPARTAHRHAQRIRRLERDRAPGVRCRSARRQPVSVRQPSSRSAEDPALRRHRLLALLQASGSGHVRGRCFGRSVCRDRRGATGDAAGRTSRLCSTNCWPARPTTKAFVRTSGRHPIPRRSAATAPKSAATGPTASNSAARNAAASSAPSQNRDSHVPPLARPNQMLVGDGSEGRLRRKRPGHSGAKHAPPGVRQSWAIALLK